MENIFTKARKQLPETAGVAVPLLFAFFSIYVCVVCLYLSCKNYAFPFIPKKKINLFFCKLWLQKQNKHY